MLTDAKWKCDPTWTGRSATFTTVIVTRGRPGFSSTGSEPTITSPGAGPAEGAIGWCTVTSFVPSGNVPSTCTESIISGTPRMTCSGASTVRPLSMRSLTVRPSRAPSSTWSVINATASG